MRGIAGRIRDSRQRVQQRSAMRGRSSTSVRAAAPTSRSTAGCWRSSRARRCARQRPRGRRAGDRRARGGTAVDARGRSGDGVRDDPSWGAAGGGAGRAAPGRARGRSSCSRSSSATCRPGSATPRRGVAQERPRFPALDGRGGPGWGAPRGAHPDAGRLHRWLLRGVLARPEALLDPEVRGGQSVWALLEPGVEQRIVDRLCDALEARRVGSEHGYLREQDSFEGALRLVISEPGAGAPARRLSIGGVPVPGHPTRRTASGASWPQLRRAQADLRGLPSWAPGTARGPPLRLRGRGPTA